MPDEDTTTQLNIIEDNNSTIRPIVINFNNDKTTTSPAINTTEITAQSTTEKETYSYSCFAEKCNFFHNLTVCCNRLKFKTFPKNLKSSIKLL